MAQPPVPPAVPSPQAASAPIPERIPRPFGRLWLLRRLARGGMGEVYLACTRGIEGAERPCVVKTIRRDHAADRSFLARFFDEARVQAQLQHPGVAQILEASTDESGEPYVVVEYVEGRSLGEVRNRAIQLGARIAWPDAVALMTAAAEALAHVHERTDSTGGPLGIVHRDLSPQNIMIGYAGDLKLIDFGTARAQNRRCRTISGVVFAKPGYVAPEVANGDPGDFRVDLYALGVMLWELLAGRRFLQGEPSAHLSAVAKGELSPPEIAKAIGAPPPLDRIIARLVAHERDARYPSTRAGAAELGRLLASAPSLPDGERGVRARIGQLMYRLYPSEPAKSRAELGALMKVARWADGESSRRDDATAKAPSASQIAAPPAAEVQAGAPREEREMVDPNRLPGTHYRLLRLIGRGAMGEVYEGEHADLLRRVAIKVLAPEHALSPTYSASFRREARAIARLEHPNIVLLHDFGQTSDGRLYCAMERLEGQTLERRLEIERVLDWRDATDIAIQICRGLQAAHAAGVVHRDLKPANVFLCADERGGRVKLLDFGIARTSLEQGGTAVSGSTGEEDASSVSASSRAGEGSDVSADVVVLGTPEYMAPEQLRSSQVDPRADVYALGCVLYEMCTGSLPYVGRSAIDTLEQKMRAAPEPMSDRARARRLPAKLVRLVQKALAPRPDARFASADALRRALEEALDAPLRRRAGFRAVGYSGIAAAVALAAAIGVSRAKHIAWIAAPAAVTGMTAPTAMLDEPIDPPRPAGINAESVGAPSEMPLQPRAADPSEERAPSDDAPSKSAPAEPERAPRSTPAASPAPPASSPPRARTASVLASASAAPSLVKSHGVLPVVAPAPSLLERMQRSRKGTRESGGSLASAREGARLHGTDPATLRRWTQAALRARSWEEATRASQAWRALDPGPEPVIALAHALSSQGRTQDASAILEELLEARPGCDEARGLLADLERSSASSAIASGKPKRALQAPDDVARNDRAP